MTEPILTYDGATTAFDDAGGVVSTEDGEVSFSWDEESVVTIDAPANLAGAFDTERFYKISDVTVARPIKQQYVTGDSVSTLKKPAEELDKGAWSFDNAPFTLGHPETGMIKRLDDVHGFWRNPRYDADEDRLKEDLYVPVTDDEALAFIEDNRDVSVGFYNFVHSDYDGNTGELTDEDGVDGYQVDILGNHIAGVERGRCSAEEGCGLDSHQHGRMLSADESDAVSDLNDSEVVLGIGDEKSTHDATTTFETQHGSSMMGEGDMVEWRTQARVAHNPSDEDVIMLELLDMEGDTTDITVTAKPSDVREMMDSDNDCPCGSTDAPSGVHMMDGDWYGVAPSENADDEPKYELNNCNDVKDAWNLRGSGDYDIDQSTLEARIKKAADAHDCPPENRPWETTDTNMTDGDNDTDDLFDIPDLRVDKIAEQNDAVQEIVDERDELRESVDEMRETVESAFDEAENFAIELDEDECACEAVSDLVEDLDEKVAEVEDLRDELSEYREEDIEERLDRIAELGGDRDEWEETADDADDPLAALDEEIERREEVADAVGSESTVKNVDSTNDAGENTDEADETVGGRRRFGRGHNA